MTTKNIENFWLKVHLQAGNEEDCWLWMNCKNKQGYGQFRWSRDTGECKAGKAHRFSYELHHGTIPEGLQVLHKCDNPSCVRPDHLFIGYNLDNIRDREAKGRGVLPRLRGEQCSWSKLSEKQCLEIRGWVELGFSQLSVAQRFGICQQHVSSIIQHRCWKHIAQTSIAP